MSTVDDWPQAPVLRDLPQVARLDRAFDPHRLVTELQNLQESASWTQPRILSGEGVGSYVTDLDWKTLPLRSIGGDADRTDPGGPSLEDFADTHWFKHVPYLGEIVDAIPAPKGCVRLMALGPGAQSPRHCDTKLGLPWGMVRLHAPVVTLPEATLSFGTDTYTWQPGSLWYADFTRLHQVQNRGTSTRIHLVIDCLVTERLMELFPEEFRTAPVLRSTVFEPEAPVRQDPLPHGRIRFPLPAAFTSFEEDDERFLGQESPLDAEIGEHDGHTALFVDGEPRFRLVPVGGGEYRFAGWRRERTLEPSGDAHGPVVVARVRSGAAERSLRIPAAESAR